MQRSTWRVSDTQSVSQGNQNGVTGTGTIYELLFLQYSGVEPDPVKRDLLVRKELQDRGLSADAIIGYGFLASSPTTLRRQELSFTLQGQRTTLTSSLTQSRSQKLGSASTGGGDLDQTSEVVQRGLSMSLAHRLTPSSSATLSLSRMESRGDDGALSTTMDSIVANWTGRLGIRTSVSLGARYTRFDSATPYRENAIFANLVQQF